MELKLVLGSLTEKVLSILPELTDIRIIKDINNNLFISYRTTIYNISIKLIVCDNKEYFLRSVSPGGNMTKFYSVYKTISLSNINLYIDNNWINDFNSAIRCMERTATIHKELIDAFVSKSVCVRA